jgi:hypothetical protein
MNAKRNDEARVDAERLLACVAGVDNPCCTLGTALHGSKIGLDAWRLAASLCAVGSPRVREVQNVCSVSYRTAWHMRQRLLDAAIVLREREGRSWDG